MEEEELELVVELCDNHLHFEEWRYSVRPKDLIKWDIIDTEDPDEGLKMVRVLLLMGLSDNSPLTWELLHKNVVLMQFLEWGVPEYIEKEIPRLSLINRAIDKMYNCLVNLAVDQNIRKVH